MYDLSFEASFYLTSTTKRKTNFVPSTVLVKSQERRAMCYGDKIDMSGNKLRLRSFDMNDGRMCRRLGIGYWHSG